MRRCQFVTIPILLALCGHADAYDCDLGAMLYQRALERTSPSARVRLLERSTQACPDPLAFAELAETRLATGDAEGALDALSDAFGASDDPAQQVQIQARMASIYRRQGRLGEAIGAIGAAFDNAPGPVPQWVWDERRAIDTHPDRARLSIAQVDRALTTRGLAARGFNARPKLDVYVHFDYDQDQPNAEGLAQLATLGAALAMRAATSGEEYRLIGHTDIQGSDAYNQGLSERRARGVRDLLASAHPALAERLVSEGRGEREPLYPGDSELDHSLNRRVEVQAYPAPLP